MKFRRLYKKREFSDEEQYKRFTGAVRKRDKNKCRFPQCKTQEKIQVHHIKTWAKNPELRYSVGNGICLCKYHHELIRGKEEEYAGIFLQILNIDNKLYNKIQKMIMDEEFNDKKET